MSELRRRLSQIEERWRTKQKEVRKTQRLLRQGAKMNAREWDILRVICALSNGCTTLSALYVKLHFGADRVPDPLQVVRRLDTWYDNLPLFDLKRWTTAPVGSAAERLLEEARMFMRDAEVHTWLERQNIERGIAPHSMLVSDQTSSHAKSGTAKSRKIKLQWARRWRRRWGVRTGVIAPSEYVPPETARRKAPKCRARGDPNLEPGAPKS